MSNTPVRRPGLGLDLSWASSFLLRRPSLKLTFNCLPAFMHGHVYIYIHIITYHYQSSYAVCTQSTYEYLCKLLLYHVTWTVSIVVGLCQHSPWTGVNWGCWDEKILVTRHACVHPWPVVLLRKKGSCFGSHMYLCVCLCICLYIYIHIYIYIHTYIRTNEQTEDHIVIVGVTPILTTIYIAQWGLGDLLSFLASEMRWKTWRNGPKEGTSKPNR